MLQPFLVKNIFTDFKRHDLGPSFYERNYDGTMQKQMMTRPLWGVASTPRLMDTTAAVSISQRSFSGTAAKLSNPGKCSLLPYLADRGDLLAFLDSLILFPPDDTASNLDPGDRTAAGFPQVSHGAIKLTGLFNDPGDIEQENAPHSNSLI